MTSMNWYQTAQAFQLGREASEASIGTQISIDPYTLQTQPCGCEQCYYYLSYGMTPPFHPQMSPLTPMSSECGSASTPHSPLYPTSASTRSGHVSAFSHKTYTHNPYAETSHLLASAQSPPDKTTAAERASAFSQQYTAPVYHSDTNYSESVTHPVAFSLEEQFQRIIGGIANAACTVRGRTLLQSVLRLQHVDKTQVIFSEVLPEFYRLSLDQNATNVVRLLMEYLNDEQVAMIINTLTVEVICTLSTQSQQSRRVLQTLFEHHHTATLDPVVNVFAAEAQQLAVTQQGCITLMRVLENATMTQKNVLIGALNSSLSQLATNPYGNYVVQAVFTAFSREQVSDIVERAFNGHWVKLACNKFGSNVMEKVVQLSSQQLRRTLVEELVMTPANLQVLMHDGFGNFVLQAIIDSCTSGTEFYRIASRVRALLPNCPYGHKIDAKLRGKKFTRSPNIEE